MIEKMLLLFLVAITAPSVLQANPAAEHNRRFGFVHLDDRFRREPGSENDAFSGNYVSLQGDGIRFHSKKGYLSITTLEDEPVFFASIDPLAGAEGFGYMKVGRKHFVYVKKDVYALPRPVDAQMLLSHTQREKLIATLQVDSNARAHAAAAGNSLDEIAQTREAALLEEAAHVLGTEYGIIGRDNPAVLPLYGIAMLWAEKRKKSASEQQFECDRTEMVCPEDDCKAESQDGQYPDCKSGKVKECPPCPGDDQCQGMCGKACCCWAWICGDCCWYQFCSDHDICCTKQGFNWWNPFSDCANPAKMAYWRLTSYCEDRYISC